MSVISQFIATLVTYHSVAAGGVGVILEDCVRFVG